MCYRAPMRMTDAQMYARVLASDADFDGRFFTGVLTTGIYCLPSCKARKPKPGNVRFFPTAESARAFGLRPCRKCHPDDFARGADPVLESIEALVGEIRQNPAAFADARAIVRRSGFGTTRCFELFRRHYHATPAEALMRARIASARHALLTSDTGVGEIGFAAGFETLSAFHENFRRLTGLTPAAYRTLRERATTSFALALPEDYALTYLRHALARDPESRDVRLEGDNACVAARLPGPAVLRFTLSPESIAVDCPAGTAVEAHRIAVGLLGLEQDAAAFARLARKLGFARLVAHAPGLRISLTPSTFDGLLWAVIGQQINFSFACRLKRRLLERCGTPVEDGMIAPPTATDVARLSADDLLPLQFSKQKAGYLLATARLIAEGKLDLDRLAHASATRAERTLLAVRGLGPWSVNYLMMRALGFADCVPLGDTGVTSGLLALMHLDERPDIDATRRLMSVFSPYRSLATAHLWMLNRTVP
ncbi:MAG: DNA-3-methyladenine glycosylase 2 family protein [Opitutaceae bacterium]|nr:DNA-3-methyladenine glycosylase 2 family protein [Opitutaceae bacterium]